MHRECRERFPPPPQATDPDMHHGTCVTHVLWCMPGSLTGSFLWGRWRRKRSRHSRRMRNPQFYVSGKRLIYDLFTRLLRPLVYSLYSSVNRSYIWYVTVIHNVINIYIYIYIGVCVGGRVCVTVPRNLPQKCFIFVRYISRCQTKSSPSLR